ncbi:mas-related G-protein coupled receptor MRG-like [Choloepus didactylus]|uniref:mas-related G-protein coupled receptor MRG-like n=1 Tax=Choloepus didactylus TaxID=27675 RepID=UPI00189F8966|nr:mas-related G-protein coupled receptor MRG-like [Choloepus didactylus]
MVWNVTIRVQSVSTKVISPSALFISLCGSLMNGTVFWLLCRHVKKNPHTVYILNLAAADLIFLSCMIIYFLKTTIMDYHKVMFYVPSLLTPVTYFSYMVCLCLLAAISTERCLCVLFPIWYKCHRPRHTSDLVCALIWALALGLHIMTSLFFAYFEDVKACVAFLISLGVVHDTLFLVMCVSSLTLLIRILCCSWQQKPTRVFIVILVSVIMFFVWGLPVSAAFLMSDVKNMAMASFLTALFFAVNSCANPILYFFVGSLRKKSLKEPLREILQRALSDKTELGRNKKPDGTDPARTPGSTQGTGDCLPMKHVVNLSK